jgi:hypothetical protein
MMKLKNHPSHEPESRIDIHQIKPMIGRISLQPIFLRPGYAISEKRPARKPDVSFTAFVTPGLIIMAANRLK